MLKHVRTARGLRLSLFCLPLLASCAEVSDEAPTPREQGSVGAEVFHVFCKRSVATAFPDDLVGTAFNPCCDGKGPIPEGRNDAHFSALIARRARIVDALDRVLGGDEAVAAELVKKPFADDELHQFLGSLIPLYDPPSLMPESTRALASVLGRLLDDKDVTGKKALDVLARTTGRVGYRPLKQALGVIRPLLEYDGLDDFIASSLALVAKGGKAEKEYDAVIHGLSLELATYEDTPLAPDSTLALTRELLFKDISSFLEPKGDETKLFLVKRDDRGVAVPYRTETTDPLPLPFLDDDADGKADIDGFGRLRAMAGLDKIPAPFAIRNEGAVERDSTTGLAKNMWDSGDKLLFSSTEMDGSMLAGLAREQLRLLTAKTPKDRTTFEKLGRGIPGLLGKTGKRAKTYGKAAISFDGPDPSTAPLLDLVHAASVIAREPNFKKVLTVVEKTMLDHEPATAQLMETLLAIDARADMHPEADITGHDGVPGHASRFWDDMIAIGQRMSAPQRAGLIEAVMRSIIDEEEPIDEPSAPNKPNPQTPSSTVIDEWNPPCEGICAPAQGKLLANWLRHKDVVNYPNAPSRDFADLNGRAISSCTEPGKAYCEPVDWSQRDVGGNRSVFQRVLGMVHGLNGQTQMNKNGATITPPGLPLTLPLLDGDGWQPGQLFVVPDMVEIHILAVLNKASIPLKDGLVQLISGGCPLNLFKDITCVGATQEKESGIKGFDANPSPESLARFVFAAPNEFLKKIADPVYVNDGAPIQTWEPLALFPMEVIDPEAKPLGQPDHPGLTFIQAGRSLMKAFESHEWRGAATQDAPAGVLMDGFLFGDLLSTLHMHWSQRSNESCMGPPANVETCTQSVDPAAPFYTYQSNLRSYEALVAEALDEERLLEVLYEASKSLSQIEVDGEDGITIMARFVEFLLRPQEGLVYRDKRATALTNLGEEVGYVSPLYLLLDALKGIDKSFDTAEHKDRLKTWREARSELIDIMLEINENAAGQKQMADRVGRAVSIEVVRFLRSRIEAHEQANDVQAWTEGFEGRVVDLLDRPVVGAALKLLDRTWEDEKAGVEFAKLTKHLFQEEGTGFAVSLLAGGDLLQLLDDVTAIAPLLDLGAEAVAPGVTSSVDLTGKAFTIDDGLARKLVELQAAIVDIDTKRPSTTAKLLQNLVNTMEDDSTPLEVLIDVIAEVERVDPTKPNDAPLDREDLKAVLGSIHHFLTDEERGIERLYSVIEHRKRGAGE